MNVPNQIYLNTPSSIKNLEEKVKKHGGWILRIKINELDDVQKKLSFLNYFQRIRKKTEKEVEIIVSENKQSLELWMNDADYILNKLNI